MTGPEAQTEAEKVTACEVAIESEMTLRLVRHTGPDENLRHTELRTLSPYEVQHTKGGKWLVLGYDHDREGIRHFNLDKVNEVGYLPDDDYIYPQEG